MLDKKLDHMAWKSDLMNKKIEEMDSAQNMMNKVNAKTEAAVAELLYVRPLGGSLSHCLQEGKLF